MRFVPLWRKPHRAREDGEASSRKQPLRAPRPNPQVLLFKTPIKDTFAFPWKREGDSWHGFQLVRTQPKRRHPKELHLERQHPEDLHLERRHPEDLHLERRHPEDLHLERRRLEDLRLERRLTPMRTKNRLSLAKRMRLFTECMQKMLFCLGNLAETSKNFGPIFGQNSSLLVAWKKTAFLTWLFFVCENNECKRCGPQRIIAINL